MRIDGLSQQPKVSRPSQRSTSVRARTDRSAAADSVEISASTPSVGELVTQAKAAEPDAGVRIAEIQSKVRGGYYDSRQVREQIADAMLDSGGMQALAGDIAQARVARGGLQQVPDTRADRVGLAKERVAEGFYDGRAVRLDTAEKILDELA